MHASSLMLIVGFLVVSSMVSIQAIREARIDNLLKKSVIAEHQQESSFEKLAKRSKRSICGVPHGMSEADQQAFVDAHNDVRRLEYSKDMRKVTWSDTLANRVKQWLDKCIWAHGLTEDCYGNNYGQNLVTTAYTDGTYPRLNVNEAVKNDWYGEVQYFNGADRTCQEGKQCDHYRQSVWGSNSQIGCAAVQCPQVLMPDGTLLYTNALLVGCDYNVGQFTGNVMYQSGNACENCANTLPGHSGYRCDNGLCDTCKPDSTDCICFAAKNCNHGKWNTTTCSCNCDPLYYGETCQNSCSCNDNFAVCASITASCEDPYYVGFMADHCQHSCQMYCPPQPPQYCH